MTHSIEEALGKVCQMSKRHSLNPGDLCATLKPFLIHPDGDPQDPYFFDKNEFLVLENPMTYNSINELFVPVGTVLMYHSTYLTDYKSHHQYVEARFYCPSNEMLVKLCWRLKFLMRSIDSSSTKLVADMRTFYLSNV